MIIFICASESFAETEKVDLLRQKAKQNDVEAQLNLANQYFYGNKRKKNYAVAVHWYRKAAKLNSRDAQYNLATCLQYGLGIEKNVYWAFEWYKTAAKNASKPARL
jgi:TPR repeat protein